MKNIISFICLILLSVTNIIFSQDVRISATEFKVNEEFVIITYDLQGEVDETYLIECFLMRDAQPNFKHKLRYVDGDIGTGKFVGNNKIIRWNFSKEFPMGLTGDDFYFLVSVDEISSGLAWYYYVGAAAIGGAAAAFLLGGSKDSKTTEAVYAPFPGRP